MSEETPRETAARKSRLRWITLGEAVAVAAVVISGLGLWNSYQDRRDARADKVAELSRTATPGPLSLRASANADGSTLSLSPVGPDDVIQSQTIRFPPAFGLAPVTTTGDARIEASWFADAMKADRKKRDLPETMPGDARVPVMIETEYLAGGHDMTARAYYDVGYALEDRFLRGTAVRLRGLSLIGSAAKQDATVDQRLTTLWEARAGRSQR